MSYYDALKKSVAYTLMHRDITEGKTAHAYLIESEDEGMADGLCSLFIARLVFGEDEDAISKAERLGSVDIVSVPEKGKEKITVDDIRSIIKGAYYTPVELDKKIIVIGKGETLNDESQNALLKVLEEPPSSVIFVLKCANVKKLLPTVLSRVRRVTIPPLPDGEVINYLKDNYPESADIYLASALSRGYLSTADEVMTSSKLRDTFELALSTLKGMKTSREILHYSALISKKKDILPDFVDALELILADCLLASTGERVNLRFRSSVKDIIELSALYTAEVVLALRPVLTRARKRIEGNGSSQSVLDELLFSLLEVKAKCQKL